MFNSCNLTTIALCRPENLTAALRSVFVQYSSGKDKTEKERTVHWDDAAGKNLHPFIPETADFFAFTWQNKVCASLITSLIYDITFSCLEKLPVLLCQLLVMRTLVDWQLTHSAIKDTIDISWEVKYERKKKKTNKTEAAAFAPPDEEDPMNIKNLRMIPLGQDVSRVRYWSVDSKSHRIFRGGVCGR